MQENQFSAGRIKGKEHRWQGFKALQGIEVGPPKQQPQFNCCKLATGESLCKLCRHSKKRLIVGGNPNIGLAFHLKGLKLALIH